MGRAAAVVATLRVGAWKGNRSDTTMVLGFRRTWQRGTGVVVRHKSGGVRVRAREGEEEKDVWAPPSDRENIDLFCFDSRDRTHR